MEVASGPAVVAARQKWKHERGRFGLPRYRLNWPPNHDATGIKQEVAIEADSRLWHRPAADYNAERATFPGQWHQLLHGSQ